MLVYLITTMHKSHFDFQIGILLLSFTIVCIELSVCNLSVFVGC